MLAKGCITKSVLSTFFGAAVVINANKNKAQSSSATKTNTASASKTKDSKTVINPEDINEEMLFGPGTTYGDDSKAEESKPVDEKKNE